ncbi:deubiquitinase OTUD6B [Leptopilina boulardi]|uniref:deubiquitinase OTUD6B n=1 Tax=Leptopilina boulardi TaxID=63433 RepID=UPI0021F50F8B|nr:deubiquitinase OTUD6B [Leptopilina boulardi]
MTENFADIINEEQLIQKHKKERKELQAQIQSLKKSIGKGNKKQKKDVTEEISRLELNLDKRQNEELINFKLSEVKLTEQINVKENLNTANETNEKEIQNTNEDEINQVPQQKTSKAQRRREKKANEEKERNQRIINEEAGNIFGKRNIEMMSIKNILVKREFKLHEIASDGNCLYNAVAHQLKVIGLTSMGFRDLRTKTALYLRENMNDFLPFIANSESEDLLTPEEYEKYCENVAKTSAWGGAVELQVLSKILQCPIEVIQATGAPYIVGDEFDAMKKLTVTYHRHMYELGAHYNSVTKHNPGERSEEF